MRLIGKNNPVSKNTNFNHYTHIYFFHILDIFWIRGLIDHVRDTGKISFRIHIGPTLQVRMRQKICIPLLIVSNRKYILCVSLCYKIFHSYNKCYCYSVENAKSFPLFISVVLRDESFFDQSILCLKYECQCT